MADRAAILRAHDEAMAAERAVPYTPHNLTPPGITCPCEFCNYRRRRNASAVWWIARAVRMLAGYERKDLP